LVWRITKPEIVSRVFDIINDMEEIITKEELDELKGLKGESRGMGLKIYTDYILQEKGEEGLKRLEETINKLGFSVKYQEIKVLNFYSYTLEALTLLVIKRLFNFSDEEFQKMGRLMVKAPQNLRLFLNFLFSLFSVERMIGMAQKAWSKQNTIGKLKVVEFNKDKRYLIVRLEDFRVHPLHCQVLRGIFSQAIYFVFQKEGTCEETKCLFREDEYHEFLLKW